MEERNFKDKFDPEEWAEIYDSRSIDAQQWIFHRGTKLVQAACSRHSRPGEFWLDAGCGTGHLTNDLSASGLKLVAFDHDRNMITAARQRFPRLNLIQANAKQFPFHSESFHGLVAVSVMGCFDSPEKFYKEAHRVLKPGGILIFTCTNKTSLLLKINARLKPRSDESFHLYNLSEVISDLRKNNFEIVDSGFYNFFLNPRKKPIPSFRVSRFLERYNKLPLMGSAARNFFVVSKRPAV
jgi:ubiquinone/menaquinone biosynthesis C-methylase UbiE